MCNKCENIHSTFFKNHKTYKLKKDDEVFTGFCKEKNHQNKLEFYCKYLYNNKYFNEDIIKKREKLPKQIKLSLEKGKLINKEWEDNNLISYINDCINIENNI